MKLFTQIMMILVITCLVTACGSNRQYSAIPANSKVIILGDSLTFGTGAGKGEDYPSLLALNSGWNIINEGVPGNTTADALERLPNILEESEISLLIIALGGNDFLRHTPEQETVNHLTRTLTLAKAKDIQVVLLAIPEFNPISAAVGRLSDHFLYEKLAKTTDTPLVENVFSDVLEDQHLKSDPIHPNAAGYRVVEEKLRSALFKLGFLTKS